MTAAAVCAFAPLAREDIADLLGKLANRSLAEVRWQCGESRYRLLDVVRQFASSKVASGDAADEVGERNSGHFLCLTETAEQRLSGAGEVPALRLLDAESGNLAAPWRFTASSAIRSMLRRHRAGWVVWPSASASSTPHGRNQPVGRLRQSPSRSGHARVSASAAPTTC